MRDTDRQLDWRRLLVAYMAQVIARESIDLIESEPGPLHELLTPAELEALSKAAEEAAAVKGQWARALW